MASGKAAQHGRGGHRKVRRLSTPERINTARPDEEHFNVALEQVNALEELPASEVGFPFTDSPTVRRLYHETYELSDGPAAAQAQMPFVQRPTSSASLQKGEYFTFGARQHRDINARREKQPPTQRQSLLQQSSPGSQVTANGGKQSFMAPVDETHSTLSANISNSIVENPQKFATTVTIDLTCASPSADMQINLGRNQIEDAESTAQQVFQAPSGSITREPQSGNLVKSAVDGLATPHTGNLGEEAPSPTSFHSRSLENGGSAQSQKPSQNLHHPLHATNARQLTSGSTYPPTAHPASTSSPVTVNEIRVSEKETHDCSGQEDFPNITPGRSPNNYHGPLSTLEIYPVPRMEPKDLEATLLPNSKEEENTDGLTKETMKLRPHTPQSIARHLPEKPTTVNKVLPSNQQVPQSAAPGFQADTELPLVRAVSSGPVSSSRDAAPSEEDLFYLLMHRQRQRKDVEARLSARLKHLETVNTRLSKQNQTYRCQISASYISRDKSAAEASFQKEALENFKTRFQKLKTFVNGLGNDYSALRQHADQIKLSQQSLLTEKEDIYRDVQSCRAASATSEQSVYNIISNFAEVRQSIVPLEESLAEGRRTLETESRLLLREQHKNKRLETYLVQVASTQNRYSSAIQDAQKAVLGQLREISAKVSAVEKATTVELQPLLLHNLDECVRMLTRIHDAERVGPADITKITHAVSSLSESFSSYRKSLSEGFQAAADAQVNSGKQLVSQINAVHETLHATAIQEGQLAGLREDKIRLEEQLKSSENVTREIREGRMSADSREIHFRATTDSLLKQLKTLQNQAIQAQKPSPPMDERDMIGTWRLKYTNISQALARSEEQVNARENKLRQGEEKVRALAVQLDVAQAEHSAAVQALNEANERACAQAGAISELQQKLADKETGLEVLRLELRSTETKFCDEAEKVEELASLRTKYANELKEVKSQLDAATKESAKANKQVCELELRMTDFAEAQQEAAKVMPLTEELHNEQSKVAKLILEIEPLEKMAGEVPRLKQQLSEKQGAIDSLEARLGEAGAASGQVRALKITALQSAEDISRLQGELLNAQSRASWAAEKQEQFHKMTQDVAEFRKKLVDLQCLADRVPGLQKEAQSHMQEVLRLQQELAVAKGSTEQLRDLEATNRHSGEEIKLLKMELHAANETLSRFQGVEDTIDRKDQEARTLNERITVAEDNLTQAVIDKENHIATMKQELDAANDSLKRLEEVECANGDKDKEIASLKEKLGAAESILKEVQIVKEESQLKEIELSVLRDRLAKREEESHRLSQTVPENPSQDQNPSQETMAAFQEAITRHERGFQTEQALVVPPVLDAASQLKRKTCRNDTFRNPQELQTRIGETIRVESTGMETFSSNEAPESPNGDNLGQVTEWQNPRTRETIFIPESQPAMHSRHEKSPVNAPSTGSISSPLTDPHHELAYFGLQKVAKRSNTSSKNFPVTFKSGLQLPVMLHGDLPSSRPPSSSTGDTMLLEAEEEPKRIENHDDKLSSDSWRQRLGPKGEANCPGRLPPGQPEDIFGNGATKSSSKIAKSKSKGDVRIISKHASPLRRRSESQTRIKKATPLQERAPDQNVPASPQGGILREKYLPNSAAKRRFEDDEISLFPSSQEGSKRLKRKLSAAEIKSPSNRKGSSFPERVTPVTGAGRLNHPSMPTGSRKRSMIGTNAPAPGLGQHSSKKSKKAPKTDRYSARFNQDTT